MNILVSEPEIEQDPDFHYEKLSPNQKLKKPHFIKMFKGLLKSSIDLREEDEHSRTDTQSQFDPNEFATEQEKAQLNINNRKSKFAGMMDFKNEVVIFEINY